MDRQTTDFLNHLHRGGVKAHYWYKNHSSRQTVWFDAGSPTHPTSNPTNVYFGVNPVGQIPPTDSKGNARKPYQVRSQNEHVCAINCLYGDFDSKDSNGSKPATLAQIRALTVPPSVIVDSGGGYHAYWLLGETLHDMDAAADYLKRWVYFTGADKSVHDLARVLRVPGTKNYKYDPAPDVVFVECDLTRVYELADLVKLLPEPEPEPERVSAPCAPVDATDQELLDAAFSNPVNGAKIKALWEGDYSAHIGADGKPDHSAADIAFCNHLAYYTGNDPGRMDKLFNASGLMRDKWDNRPIDYAKVTIDNSIAVTHKFWIPYTGNVVDEPPFDLTQEPPPVGDLADLPDVEKVETRKASKRLTSAEYHALFEQWGYDVRLNLCNDDVEVSGEILTDQVEASIRQRARDYAIINYRSSSVGATEDSIRTAAAKQKYHPVKDYLDGLVWDGIDHIGALLEHFTHDDYLDRWLDTWLPGAVARVYEGWQNPMLVLDGPQGIGKSYLAQWLCSPLPSMFIESPICPEYKDHRLRLVDNFVWEVQELGATTRKADQDALKAFLTLQQVSERKAYGKRPIRKPAICSFIGTVNPDDAGFLTDRTGNRRYMVTTLQEIDWRYSQDVDVNQVWAQAVALYRAGDAWKLTKVEREKSDEKSKAYLVDEPIELFLEQSFRVTGDTRDKIHTAVILETLERVHRIPPTRQTSMTVARVLKSKGAIKADKKLTINKRQAQGYYGVVQI